jgi:hypothetical protein
MALMLGKLYDALRAGNVPEREAREAAEEVASYERDIAGLRTEIRVVQGLAGVEVVVLFAALWQLFGLRGEISGGLALVGARLDAVEQRLDQRLVAVERRLDSIERRLPAASPVPVQ